MLQRTRPSWRVRLSEYVTLQAFSIALPTVECKMLISCPSAGNARSLFNVNFAHRGEVVRSDMHPELRELKC